MWGENLSGNYTFISGVCVCVCVWKCTVKVTQVKKTALKIFSATGKSAMFRSVSNLITAKHNCPG